MEDYKTTLINVFLEKGMTFEDESQYGEGNFVFTKTMNEKEIFVVGYSSKKEQFAFLVNKDNEMEEGELVYDVIALLSLKNGFQVDIIHESEFEKYFEGFLGLTYVPNQKPEKRKFRQVK